MLNRSMARFRFKNDLFQRKIKFYKTELHGMLVVIFNYKDHSDPG